VDRMLRGESGASGCAVGRPERTSHGIAKDEELKAVWSSSGRPAALRPSSVCRRTDLNRWYEAGTGRYSRVDPLRGDGDPHPYVYAMARPTVVTDHFGEKARVCCTPVPFVPGKRDHCFVQVRDDE
jgi:hypothetical protein